MISLMYLYHYVPERQNGPTLYPLNQLKDIFPDIYEKQAAKYDTIAEKDVEIPGFGFWNDCVNLMPVNPGFVKQELERYGHDTNWAWRFYQIDARTLDASKLIIMVMDEASDGSLQRTFLPFTQENFNNYCHIGDATRACFQKAREMGEQPNTFARVPHVLYEGSIDTTGLTIVEF